MSPRLTASTSPRSSTTTLRASPCTSRRRSRSATTTASPTASFGLFSTVRTQMHEGKNKRADAGRYQTTRGRCRSTRRTGSLTARRTSSSPRLFRRKLSAEISYGSKVGPAPPHLARPLALTCVAVQTTTCALSRSSFATCSAEAPPPWERMARGTWLRCLMVSYLARAHRRLRLALLPRRASTALTARRLWLKSRSVSSSTLHSQAPRCIGAFCPLRQVRFARTDFSATCSVLPVRREILLGILNCDLIGFHTYDYARHFLSSCSRLLGLKCLPDSEKRTLVPCDSWLTSFPQGVELVGRQATVGTFPIGIEPTQFLEVRPIPPPLLTANLPCSCSALRRTASSRASPPSAAGSKVSRSSSASIVSITSRASRKSCTHLKSSSTSTPSGSARSFSFRSPSRPVRTSRSTRTSARR